MKLSRLVFLLIILLNVFFFVSCNSGSSIPDISLGSIPSLTPKPTPSNITSNLPDFLQETEAFSYIEYKQKDEIEPVFSKYFACFDNIITYKGIENNLTKYGFMDLAFQPLTGLMSDKPTIFHNGFSIISENNKDILIDNKFSEIKMPSPYLFLYNGQIVVRSFFTSKDPLEQSFAYNLFDFETYGEMDPEKLLVPELIYDDPETNMPYDKPKYGYKTFGDKYIRNVPIKEGWVISPVFDYASLFSYGYSVIKINGLYGCIDETGNIVIETKNEDLRIIGSRLIESIKEYLDAATGELLYNVSCIINFDGEKLTEYEFINISPISSGFFRAQKASGQMVYFNQEGKLLGNKEYIWGEVFSEDRALVLNEKGYYFIDTYGMPINNGNYSYAKNFSSGLAAVRTTLEKWGYINKLGELIIQPQYSYAGDFDSGYALVIELKSGAGYLIDEHGNAYLEELKLTNISKFNKDGYALAYSEFKNGDKMYRTYYVVQINDLN